MATGEQLIGRPAAEAGPREIFAFWYPLALSWVMMSVAGPIVNAGISRLPDPEVQLAAFGVAQPIAILVESPIIYLLGATVSIVHDRSSFGLMRRFMLQLSLAITLLFAVVALTPVYDILFRQLLQVPGPVADAARPAISLLLPWPAAIAWRRFYQGVLIQHGYTRLITLGTVYRLATLIVVVVAGLWLGSFSGAMLGGLAMVLSVIVEAAVITWWAVPVVRRHVLDRDESGDPPRKPLGRAELWRFYLPLAATDVMRVASQPLLVAGITRAAAPALALAAWPLANGLVSLIASAAMAFQEVVIALLNKGVPYARMARFVTAVGGALSLLLVVLVATPLRDLYFLGAIGAPPDVEPLAVQAAAIMALLPLVFALRNLYRAGLIVHRRTGVVQGAMLANLITLVATLVVGIALFEADGTLLAAVAMLLAHLVEAGILRVRFHRALAADAGSANR
jgi:hypothetical protein